MWQQCKFSGNNSRFFLFLKGICNYCVGMPSIKSQPFYHKANSSKTILSQRSLRWEKKFVSYSKISINMQRGRWDSLLSHPLNCDKWNLTTLVASIERNFLHNTLIVITFQWWNLDDWCLRNLMSYYRNALCLLQRHLSMQFVTKISTFLK